MVFRYFAEEWRKIMKSYTITVNGNVYDVTVEEGVEGAAPVAAAAPKAAPKAAAPKAAKPTDSDCADAWQDSCNQGGSWQSCKEG